MMITRDFLLKSDHVVSYHIRDEENDFTPRFFHFDTREINSNLAFVALNGDVRKGVEFISACIEKGVRLAVVNEADKNLLPSQWEKKISVIFVRDSLLYFQERAAHFLRDWKLRHHGYSVAITGSNGKTTTKEFIGQIFQFYLGEHVFYSKKNFNNHIGVPFQIFQLQDHHKIAVFEIGMNHQNELMPLCLMVDPDAGLITNIGPAHIENFTDCGGLAGIFQEKKTLFDYICECKKENGLFVVNEEDLFLKNLPHYHFVRRVSSRGDLLDRLVPLLEFQGAHNFMNFSLSLVLCQSILQKLEMWNEEVLFNRASEISLPEKRMEWKDYKGKKIFFDAYNANPASMKSSLKTFLELKIPKEETIYILGDMNELGEWAPQYHKEIGDMLAQSGITSDQIFFIGRYAKFYAEGYRLLNGQVPQYFENKSDFVEKLWKNILSSQETKVIFLKASRGVELETLLS